MTNKELLKWFKNVIGIDDSIDNSRIIWKKIWNKLDEQAYQEIKSLLKSQEPTDEERKEMLGLIDNIILDLDLNEEEAEVALNLLKKIRSLILAKPKKVSRKFVDEVIDEWSDSVTERARVKNWIIPIILKEAGVEIEE